MQPTRRICLALDLQNDPNLIKTYRDWHAPGQVPAAVTASIRAADIVELEIYLTGDRLFMIMEVGPDFDPARKSRLDAENPDVQSWEALMWRFQKALPFADPGEKWRVMERIYALSEQV